MRGQRPRPLSSQEPWVEEVDWDIEPHTWHESYNQWILRHYTAVMLGLYFPMALLVIMATSIVAILLGRGTWLETADPSFLGIFSAGGGFGLTMILMNMISSRKTMIVLLTASWLLTALIVAGIVTVVTTA